MGDPFHRSLLRTPRGRFRVSLPPRGEFLLGTPEPLSPAGAAVSYVQREKRQCWSLATLEFTVPPGSGLAPRWVDALQRRIQLHGVTRPKKLLVFVNPVGGRCRASKIYQDQVAGLFALAGIQTEVVETQRPHEAGDMILQRDLSDLDGLVCVGGDGTFNEVMHALISRTQTKAGISEDDPMAQLLPPRLHIGIIPAGSTDCVCFASVGTSDPVTSALHIIIGDSQPLDVCSVHHRGRLQRYAVSLVGYGFYGDVVRDSEQHRWLGPVRYDFSGLKAVLCNRSYAGTVEFLTARGTETSPRDQTRCRAGCLICSEAGPQLRGGSQEKLPQQEGAGAAAGEWQREQGRFLAINLTCMSSACPKSPEGLSPSAHLADGSADLILVRECSSLGFLRHLSRHMDHRDQGAQAARPPLCPGHRTAAGPGLGAAWSCNLPGHWSRWRGQAQPRWIWALLGQWDRPCLAGAEGCVWTCRACPGQLPPLAVMLWNQGPSAAACRGRWLPGSHSSASTLPFLVSAPPNTGGQPRPRAPDKAAAATNKRRAKACVWGGGGGGGVA
ncbi:ceramide kinase-like isoform X3 [Pelodiscus sinensis]|uniref:ceramide kinase-like isoform X3 n=1 Tax=Pelodiscus sinensis TaxID=13735 RepID=UPI003F6D6C1F